MDETSLTTPADRTGTFKHIDARPLDDNELAAASEDLIRKSYENYPKLDRRFADPAFENQKYSLHSFIPAKGATPDKDGVFGMFKFRGSFATAEEAQHRARWLIKNVDSFHTIYTGFVGRPLPACIESSQFSQEVDEVQLKERIEKDTNENLIEKRNKEREEMKEMERREKELIEDTKEKETDPHEYYTMLRVKKAQLVWTYLDTLKKMEDMKKSIINTREEIKKMDNDDPSFKRGYYERYMNARKEANLPDDDNSFMQFLVEDKEPELGF